MGEVWEARDSRLDRVVAIKLIPKHLSVDPEARKRFAYEAKAASSIEHANICTIHEIDETPDGEIFIVMPRYQGDLLSERIAGGRMPLLDSLKIIEKLAGALADAHDNDIVHRDVKPANIIIDPNERPILLDFGLAKLSDYSKVTKTGTTVGTLAYMAPEQAVGGEVDGRADLFSLGVILYELVTGERPFTGDHDAAVLYNIAHEDPAPLAQHDPTLPPELQAIVARALAKNPSDRYRDLHEFKNVVGGLRRELQLSTGRTTGTSTPARPKINWIIPVVSVLVIAAAMITWKLLPKDGGTAEASEHALAVMEFQDLTSSGSDNLSAGLSELVNIGLIESSPVRVMTPEYLQDIRRRLFGSSRGAIENDQMIEVARESGATLMLAGRIVDTGEERYVTWRLVDTQNGEGIDGRKVLGNKLASLANEIVGGVIRVIADVSGAAPPAAPIQIERITTDSPEAYDHYVAGVLFRENNQGEQAEEEWQRAVALDPTFALAHLELGRLYWSGLAQFRDLERAETYLDRADSLKNHLGSRDRLRLEAAQYDRFRNTSRVIATYEKMLERWPDDRQAMIDLMDYLMRSWDFKGAAEVAARGLDLYPRDVNTFGSIYVNMLYSLGSAREAFEIAQRNIMLFPKSANLWDDIALVWLALGEPDSAETAVRKTMDIDSSFGNGERMPMVAYCKGDLERAIQLTEHYLSRSDLSASARRWRMTVSTVEFGLGGLNVEAGRYRRARSIYDEAWSYCSGDRAGCVHAKSRILLRAGRAREAYDLGLDIREQFDTPRGTFYSMRVRAHAAVALGDLEAARSAVTELYRAQDDYGKHARAEALMAESKIDLAENDPEGALRSLDELRRQGVPFGGLFDIEYRETRARAHRLAGRLDEAVKVHRELLRIYGGHALSHYELGLLFEEMQRPDDARREYARFLEMWAGADEDVPQRIDAERRLADLR